MRSSIAFFFTRHKKFFRRFYWFCIITIVALIFAIPISMGIRNPEIRLLDFHGPPPDLMREWNLAVLQAQREQGRLDDFVILVNRLSASYPYLELVERHNNVDYLELAVVVFDELTELARYEITPGFFINFVSEEFLSHIGNFGGLRLTSEPHANPSWISQPYFFGHYDWRFYDDRFDIPILDDNISTEFLDEGILYLRINTFLPKGYEPITLNPFWNFCFDAEKESMMDLFNNSINDLIIDIRGIGSGFRDYFVPLILAPHLHEPMSTRFYAFHADRNFPNAVSHEYRNWYGLGEAAYKETLNFIYDLPENVTLGFPAAVTVQPIGDAAFEGRIWLITDSDNFSGPNFAYLQMARDAGFTIVYEENAESIGWATSFTNLPNSRLFLRYNPLFFTDATGRSFEETGAVYDYRLSNFHDLLGVALP